MSFRAESAGYQLGGAVVEMVNLMYQNRTAEKFYAGLVACLGLEIERRELNNMVVKITSTNSRVKQGPKRAHAKRTS
jgi:hypothetical protein